MTGLILCVILPNSTSVCKVYDPPPPITASFMTSPLCLMLLPALTTSQGFTFTITATAFLIEH